MTAGAIAHAATSPQVTILRMKPSSNISRGAVRAVKNVAYYASVIVNRRKFLATSAGIGAIGWMQPPSQPPAAHPPAPPPAQTPGPPGEATPGRVRKLGLGDGDRDGLLYAPVDYTADKPLPL